MIDIVNLLPAACCAICQSSHLPGQRIVAGFRGWLLLKEPKVRVPEGAILTDVTTPEGPRVMATQGAFWTDEARQRAAQAFGAGLHPWMCQRCLNWVCPDCGGMIDRPIMHSLLADDGSHLNCALLGLSPRCTKCSKVYGRATVSVE